MGWRGEGDSAGDVTRDSRTLISHLLVVIIRSKLRQEKHVHSSVYNEQRQRLRFVLVLPAQSFSILLGGDAETHFVDLFGEDRVEFGVVGVDLDQERGDAGQHANAVEG